MFQHFHSFFSFTPFKNMAFKAWQTPRWACDGSTFSIAAATLPQPTGDRGEILAEIRGTRKETRNSWSQWKMMWVRDA